MLLRYETTAWKDCVWYGTVLPMVSNVPLLFHSHSCFVYCSTLACTLQIQLSVDEDLYLTTDDRDQSLTTAIVSSCAVGLVFLGILVLFAVYDARVSRRQVMLLGTATKLYKIVSGLFPKIVKDRMMSSSATTNGVGDKDKTRTDASQGGLSSSYHDAPIADLFPETTILFADVRIHVSL